MKRILAFELILFCTIANATHAGIKADNCKQIEVGARRNPIAIYNNTGMDIAYMMGGTVANAIYGIKKDMSDIYHSGIGDDNAVFKVGICARMNGNGLACTVNGEMKPCASGHYNAELISTISINSLVSCIITCADGSSASCKISN